MANTKQYARPPKKQKSKVATPQTADEFQEAADREEEAGGKHRVGDPAKSGRAFVRALDLYDQGLQNFPTSFDLAYNKARLQLEITQQPDLVEHIGLPLIDMLKQTLDSHRFALRLNDQYPDLLFNSAQVLTSLAEQLSEAGQSYDAIPLLQESLELLSSCLSRQEMLLEQQKIDVGEMDEGGVALDEADMAASAADSDPAEEFATVEAPITATDLLDTVHASLSSLTTLVPLVEESALQTYGDMAHSLTEKWALTYIGLLPSDQQDTARFQNALDRAIFVAAFSDAQYSFLDIDTETYLQRLEAFNIQSKEQSADALISEAEARMEFSLSTIDRLQSADESIAQLCWKQLSLSQDLLSTAAKLDDEQAKDRRPRAYASKGDVELLRHRLASTAGSPLSESIKRSAKTLIQNSQTYYKGAAQLARSGGDHALETKAKQRWMIAADIAAIMYGLEVKEAPCQGNTDGVRSDLVSAVESVVEEGFIEAALGQEIVQRIAQ